MNDDELKALSKEYPYMYSTIKEVHDEIPQDFKTEKNLRHFLKFGIQGAYAMARTLKYLITKQ